MMLLSGDDPKAPDYETGILPIELQERNLSSKRATIPQPLEWHSNVLPIELLLQKGTLQESSREISDPMQSKD